MAFQIKLDQAGRPPGVAGFAREDLVVGTAVVATVVGGPFASYSWQITKPTDVVLGLRSACALSAPTSSATNVSPIDLTNGGTYRLTCSVDAGFGLGARPEDVVSTTFWAGPVLSADPTKLPRRTIAFGERTEHNVPDAIDPSGNADGWARERQRWDSVLGPVTSGGTPIFAAVRVSLPGGGPAAIVKQKNVASVTRTGLGTCLVVFTSLAADANYVVTAVARGTTGGSCTTNTETTGQFVVERGDIGGALVDADFDIVVTLGG